MRTANRSVFSFSKALAVVGAAGLLSACSATTGIDVEVRGGDVVGIQQIQVSGQVGDGGVMLTAVKAPSTPRPFGAVEDVRIVLPDDDADQIVWVTVQAFNGNGQPIEEAKGGAAVLVANHTKRIRVCYADANCSPDGGQ